MCEGKRTCTMQGVNDMDFNIYNIDRVFILNYDSVVLYSIVDKGKCVLINYYTC